MNKQKVCANCELRFGLAAIQLEILRQENAQLRAQLDAERRNSSRQASTSSSSAAFKRSTSKSSLAPPVSVKPLVFPVFNFVAIGKQLILVSRQM